jgi:hypothetical protein
MMPRSRTSGGTNVVGQDNETRTVMRAAPSAYVRFGLICGGIILMWAFILTGGPGGRAAWIAAAIVVAISIVTMLWVIRFRLAYGGDTIRYRTFFGGEVEADVRMIASANLISGTRTYGDRFRPRIRLELIGKPGAPFDPIPVNVRIFRSDEFKRFSTFLSQRIRP